MSIPGRKYGRGKYGADTYDLGTGTSEWVPDTQPPVSEIWVPESSPPVSDIWVSTVDSPLVDIWAPVTYPPEIWTPVGDTPRPWAHIRTSRRIKIP